MNHTIEQLESRIAPAAVFVSAKVGTFTDADGDLVTVKFSKPVLTAANVGSVLVEHGNGLEMIDLTVVGAAATGTDIAVLVKQKTHGDGFANVGFVNAEGIDLGNVSLGKSDLGRIIAGDGHVDPQDGFIDPTTKIGAAKAVVVNSMGVLGTFTQPSGGDLKSEFDGKVGKMQVRRGVYDAQLTFQGNVGSIGIGGSIYGHDQMGEGSIDVKGFTGALSITGDIHGGSATETGFIFLENGATAVKVGGSLYGGTANNTGGIRVGYSASSISIGGDIHGGDMSVNGQTLTRSGFVQSPGINVLTVRGSLIAGSNTSITGQTALNGSISVGVGDFFASKVVVMGSLIGNVGPNGVETSATIETSANYTPFPVTSNVIVRGDLIHAQILGGYLLGQPSQYNGGTSLGTVSIGGDVIASSIICGVAKGANGRFGGGDDQYSVSPAVNPVQIPIQKIASIIIGGNVIGTQTAGDSFAIAAEQIGKLTIGGVAIPLTAGKSNDNFTIGFGGDVSVEEVTRPQ